MKFVAGAGAALAAPSPGSARFDAERGSGVADETKRLGGWKDDDVDDSFGLVTEREYPWGLGVATGDW